MLLSSQVGILSLSSGDWLKSLLLDSVFYFVSLYLSIPSYVFLFLLNRFIGSLIYSYMLSF